MSHSWLMPFLYRPQVPFWHRPVYTLARVNPLCGELQEAAQVRALEAVLRCEGGQFGSLPKGSLLFHLLWLGNLTSRTRFSGYMRDECAVFPEPRPESLGLASQPQTSQHRSLWNLLALCFGEYTCRFPVGQMVVLESSQVLVLCMFFIFLSPF